MSIKAYSSIVQNLSSSNYFDIYDENLNKIRFALKEQQLYISSYNPTTGEWTPANVIFDNTTSQTNTLIDFQDIFNVNNVRIDLDMETSVNGLELMIFEYTNNLHYLKRSGLNFHINSSPYLPTNPLEDRAIVYQLDANGNPRMTLSNVSLSNLSQNFVTLSDNQSFTGIKTFGASTLQLAGVGGNLTLNASQAANSAAYTLEFPTAAPSGVLNMLTTSGNSPYSKFTWTDLSVYANPSNLNQISALNTTGSPTFANLTIASGGALNLNYMSAPASSDILATLNTNKQLTNSGVSLSTLCTLGSAQTFSADKTFNYSAGKIKLSNYSTDNTSTNNFLTINASGYIIPCNKLYSDMVDVASTQTISGDKTFSGAATLSGSVTLSGVSSDTTASSGQKLAVLNTTSNAVERVNITPNTILTTTGAQTISGDKTFSGTSTFNNGKLLLNGTGSNNITLNAPSTLSSSYTWNLPETNPSVSSTYALTTNGTSSPYELSWSDLSGTYLSINTASSTYTPLSSFNQLNQLLTTGSPTFKDVTISGNLTVAGTIDRTSVQNLEVVDKTITAAYSTSPTDALADQAGFIILGATPKSILWNNAASNLTCNQDFNLSSGKSFQINNASLLSDLALTLNPSSSANNSTIYFSGAATNNTWRIQQNDSTSALSFGNYQSSAFVNTLTLNNDALILSYLSTISDNDTIATINSAKKLVSSSVSLATLATLNTTQTITGDKTFSGATTLSSSVTLSGVSSDTSASSGQKLAVLNTTSNVVERVNITPDTIVTTTGSQTISGAKTFSSSLTLSGVNSDTTASSGQKLAVLNTTSNAVERVNITPDNLVTLSGSQTISGDKTLSGATTISGAATLSSSVTLSGVNSDTTASSGQKLMVLDTTLNNIQRINISPDILMTTTSSETISGEKTFQTDKCKVSNIFATGGILSFKNSTSSSLNFIFNTRLGSSADGWVTLDPNGSANAPDTGVALWDKFLVNGSSTFQSTVILSGTNSDTATSSGQKLAVLNTTSNAIERVNITPNTLVTTSSGTQTIAGDKTFTGTTRTLTLENPGSSAQAALTYTGTVTFDSSANLRWTGDILIQSIDRSFLTMGYNRITCPTSGTLTHFKTDNTTTTVTCTASGIPMNPVSDWSALYYVITNGMGASTVNAQFRVVDLNNSTFRVNNNWILLAMVNKDNGNNLKWIPSNVSIPAGGYLNGVCSRINEEIISGTLNAYSGYSIGLSGPTGRYIIKVYAFNGNDPYSESTTYCTKIDSSNNFSNIRSKDDFTPNGSGVRVVFTNGAVFGWSTSTLAAFNNTGVNGIWFRAICRLLI